MRAQNVLPLALGVVLAATPLLAGAKPLTVSPGHLEQFLVAESACPTFSWASVSGARVYDLAVSAASEHSEASTGAPVLERTLRGQVTSWSPALAECLDPGSRYGWSIRAQIDTGWTSWSQVRFFEVPAAETVVVETNPTDGSESTRGPSPGGHGTAEDGEAGASALPPGALVGFHAEVHGDGYSPLVAVYGEAVYDFNVGNEYLAGLFEGTVKVNGGVRASNLVTNSYAYVSGNLTVDGETDIFAALEGTQPYPLCMGDNNGGVLMRCSSSRRFKQGIRPLELPGLDTVAALEPVQFRWATGETDLGFIAEDVAAVDPLLATFGEHGDVQGVKYRQLAAVLVKALQEQRAEFAAFRVQIERELAGLRSVKSCGADRSVASSTR